MCEQICHLAPFVPLQFTVSTHPSRRLFLQVDNNVSSLPACDIVLQQMHIAVNTGSCCCTLPVLLSQLRTDIGSTQYFIRSRLCFQNDVELSHEQWRVVAYKHDYVMKLLRTIRDFDLFSEGRRIRRVPL
jgi:hypothetical protein